MKMEVTFVGGGGHCRSLCQMIPAYIAVKGYTDCQEIADMPLRYLGTDNAVGDDWIHIAVALGTDDSLAARRRLIDKFKPTNKFVTLIAETAICADNSEIGPGCAIMHGVIVNGAKIGWNCIVNSGAIIEHEAKIEENCFIGPGAVICGGVEIGRDVIVGAGATIRNGVRICAGSVIGMGAVVTADITEPGKYVGIPARKI